MLPWLQDCVPTREVYDGLDNDCDGIIDENQCNMLSCKLFQNVNKIITKSRL